MPKFEEELENKLTEVFLLNAANTITTEDAEQETFNDVEYADMRKSESKESALPGLKRAIIAHSELVELNQFLNDTDANKAISEKRIKENKMILSSTQELIDLKKELEIEKVNLIEAYKANIAKAGTNKNDENINPEKLNVLKRIQASSYMLQNITLMAPIDGELRKDIKDALEDAYRLNLVK